MASVLLLVEEKIMRKKALGIVLFVLLCLTAITISVSADQEGSSCWCNVDQHGCWITGENGGKSYIMFWSESSRDYIMGKGSKAPIVSMYDKAKLPLECGIDRSSVVVAAAPAGGQSGDSGSTCENEACRNSCKANHHLPDGYCGNDGKCICSNIG